MSNLFQLIRFTWPLHFILYFTNWLPDNVIFLRLRGFLASFFFKKCGNDLRIGRNVTFYNPSKIEIGNSVYIAYGCWFLGAANLVIEDEVLFGPYVVVSPSNHTIYNHSFRFGEPVCKDIRIRKGAWIGAHCTIVIGAEVGKGAMIAANSVLNAVVEDNMMFGGVPAKFIKTVIES
jgi:acetyltransferase-like isoleucine patch superfamily enzyme